MPTSDIPPWITDSVPEPAPAPAPVRPGDAIYTLQGYHMRETEKAVLFEVHQINGAPWDPEDPQNQKLRQHWFPLSQVKSITHASKANGDSAIQYDNIQVKEWILKSKELL